MARKPLDRIRTGRHARRWRLASAGMRSGARVVRHLMTDVFYSPEERRTRRRALMSAEARRLVEELGQLKGSLVKVGQMLAVYGEHVLPVEVTEALHTLESDTRPLDWSVMEPAVREALGAARYAELEIDPEPIGAASLAQVHRATRRSDGAALCLKIQYPGIRDALDSDLDQIAGLIRWSGLLSGRRDFDGWLQSVRVLLHREVDYRQEAATTERFRERLADDPRYAVPTVFPHYSADTVLAMSHEPGLDVTDERIQRLSLARRNRLGEAFLALFFREVFDWHEMQTDPNFGNYRVRPGRRAADDTLVLLDFGAVQTYPAAFMNALQTMIDGAYRGDREAVRDGAIRLGVLDADAPASVQRDFTDVCASVIEPLCPDRFDVPPEALNRRGQYRWRESRLPRRVSRRAARAAFSRHYRVPPGEFLLLSRKLVGVYTFIAALGAEFTGDAVAAPWLPLKR